MINSPEESPLLLAGDGVLWSGPSDSIADWPRWTRIGSANPDHDAWDGVSLHGAIYVSVGHRIWSTFDQARSWMQFDWTNDVVAMAIDERSCWAIDHEGHLLRTETGRHAWESWCDVSTQVGCVWSIATTATGVLVVGTRSQWDMTFASVVVDSSRRSAVLPTLRGRSWNLSAKASPMGILVVATDALYRLDGTDWKEIDIR
jgi:hypothetical protein